MTLSSTEQVVLGNMMREFAKIEPDRRIDIAAIFLKIAVIEGDHPIHREIRRVTGLDAGAAGK